MLTLAPIASHSQESPVAPHFNCLNLRSAMVPLKMLMSLCDPGANGVTLPKEIYCISFQFSLIKENNDAICDVVGIM